MPKYTIKIRQWIEEIAEVVVEADSPQEALDNAKTDDLILDDPDWSEGSDVEGPEPYAIELDGKPVMTEEELKTYWSEW